MSRPDVDIVLHLIQIEPSRSGLRLDQTQRGTSCRLRLRVQRRQVRKGLPVVPSDTSIPVELRDLCEALTEKTGSVTGAICKEHDGTSCAQGSIDCVALCQLLFSQQGVFQSHLSIAAA